ncbi:MAG: hypothetical protein R2695_13470 [Acidimicrobiales bacterium]
MARPCAVVGIGQTKYKRRRDELSLDGLVREAALRASTTRNSPSPTSTRSCSARPPMRSRA